MRRKINSIMAKNLRKNEYAVDLKELEKRLEFTEYFRHSLGRDQWSIWGFIAYVGSQKGFEYAIQEEGCKPRQKQPICGWSFLHLSVVSGDPVFVPYLIEVHHLDPEAFSSVGMNALHLAAYCGHFELVKMLIETYDMDPNVKSKSGNNALDFAVQGRVLVEVVDYFIEKCRMDPHQRNSQGFTLLHHAASIGHAELFFHLRKQYQLDPNVKTRAGQSLFSLALEQGDLETLLLVSEERVQHSESEVAHILAPKQLLIDTIKTLIHDESSKLTEAIERLRAYDSVLMDLILQEDVLTLSEWVTLFYNKHWVDILGAQKYAALEKEIRFRRVLFALCDVHLTRDLLREVLQCAQDILSQSSIKRGIFFQESLFVKGLKKWLEAFNEESSSSELSVEDTERLMRLIDQYRHSSANVLTRVVDNLLMRALESTQTLKAFSRQERGMGINR